MIEFHESEYFQSPLEEDTLRILLNFLPREDFDKLLIRQVQHVRSYNRSPTHRMAQRHRINRIRYGRIRIIETEESEEAAAAVYPLAVGG